MIGEYLYQLRARDDQVTPLDLLCQRDNFIASAVTLTTLYVVPTDKVLRLQNVFHHSVGGAAQAPTVVTIRIVDPVTLNAFADLFVTTGPVLVGLQNFTSLFGLDTYVHPGFGIRFQTTFAAGAVANQITTTLMGFLMPRGNISQGGIVPTFT